MPNEIIRKLKTLLNQGICSEAEVVYLLVGIRKLLELDGELKKTFPNLPFYCDWVLHADLHRKNAREILESKSIKQILEMNAFRDELSDFLFAKLDAEVEWQDFLRLYVKIISDISLKLKEEGTVREQATVRECRECYEVVWETFDQQGSATGELRLRGAYAT